MPITNIAITAASTGAAPVFRATTADPTKTIASQVLDRPKTQYINGSGMSFMNGTLTTFPVNPINTETYFLPNEDCISEILLQMSFNCTLDSDEQVSTTLLLDLINKIEMKVGNLTIQTILPGDIYARNLTENGHLLKVEHSGTTTSPSSTGIHSDGTYFDFSMSVPFIGRNSGLERSFLQTGSVAQQLTMKVTYNKNPGLAHATTAIHNLIAASNITNFKTGICVFSHNMTLAEKNLIASGPSIQRSIKTSQGIRFAENFTASRDNTSFTFNLSNIDINVTHILLSLERGVFSTTGEHHASLTKNFVTTGTCWRPRDLSENVGEATVGVLKGWLKSADLILENDRTNDIPAACITTNRLEQFGLSSVDNKNIYIIKLGETAFSTAGIPFSKLNQKKLKITFNALAVANLRGSTDNNQCILNVTCCGTKVQTLVSSTMSFTS